MKTEILHSETRALCPSCREIVNASIIEKEGRIYLKKMCEEHGVSYALTCSDPEWYHESTNYVKPGQSPLGLSVKEFKGCPDSCGLCPEHQQHTCLPVIEIMSGCDMECPICLKDFDKSFQMTKTEFRNILKRLKAYEPDLNVINLSGGEPTLHPELEEFLKISAEENINQVTVSTNGVKLLNDKRLREVFRETGTIASLQFDGFLPQTYERLRGRDLYDQKKKIIAALEEDSVKYSLVTTVAKNINDHEITDIVDYFFHSKALSLMFQPATFTGRAAANDFDPDTLRITIPDIVREIEKNENVKKGDFNPIPCSHYSCFAVSYYLKGKGDPVGSPNLSDGDLTSDDEKYVNMKDLLGQDNFINIHTNRTYPGLDEEGFSIIQERIFGLWSASDSSDVNQNVLKRIRSIFNQLNRDCFSSKEVFEEGSKSMKSIFIHQLMDVHTLDIARLKKCCNHYALGDGRIIPMCAQNVFFQ